MESMLYKVKHSIRNELPTYYPKDPPRRGIEKETLIDSFAFRFDSP